MVVGLAALAFFFFCRGRRTKQGRGKVVERSDSIPVGPRMSQVPKPEILPSSDVMEPPSPQDEIPGARLRSSED